MAFKVDFPDLRGDFCLLSNLRNFLSYYNLNVSEDVLGVVTGYMGFCFYERCPRSKEVVHGRDYSYESIIDRFQRCLDYPLNTQKCSPESIIGLLEQLLGNNYVPLVWVNEFYFEHSPYYRLCDYKGLVPVIAIEELQVKYFDNGARWINRQNFLKSIQLNHTSTVHYTEDSTLSWNQDERLVLNSGLKTIAHNIINSRRELGIVTGRDGMEMFMRNVECCSNVDDIFNYYFQLNRPGGLAVTRDTLRKFFSESRFSERSKDAEKSVKAYEELASQWRIVANNLFKLSRVYDADLHKRIINRIQTVIESESRAADILMQFSSNKVKGR